MTKDRAILDARRASNREGKTMAVLNLNLVGSPLYVIREMQPEFEASKRLVYVAHPETIDQGG